MSRAIEDLKNEHNAILSGLQILSAITSRMDRGLEVNKRSIRDFLGFLKEFADKCHHGKEEGFLFPALKKAGLTGNSGTVEVMVAEHARGRELLAQMEKAFSGSAGFPQFSRAAKDYSALLRSHIEKENGALFPSAETILSEQLLDQIYDSFEHHEQKAIGAARHEELHAILKTLKQKYFV